MPRGYVYTIRDEIFYEYAKLISRSVFGGKINYAFVSNRFKVLYSGKATISGTNREWKREQELPNECVFCGCKEDLQLDHLPPDPVNHRRMTSFSRPHFQPFLLKLFQGFGGPFLIHLRFGS